MQVRTLMIYYEGESYNHLSTSLASVPHCHYPIVIQKY